MSRMDVYFDLIDDAARDPSTDLDQVFKTLFQDVDARISDTEGRVLEIEAIKASILETVLNYNAEKLLPEFDRVRTAADLGLLLRAQSTTSLEVGLGVKEFFVSEEDRGRFSPSAYLGAMKTGDPGIFMAGALVSYDKPSGRLLVTVDRVSGSGSAASWTISPVSPTDYAEAAGEAATSATEASGYADDAAAHAAAALGHRNAAETQKDLAEDARDAAVVAKTAAEAAETNAEAHYLGVQSIAQYYLGPSASNPTTGVGGAPLAVGMIYWNTASNEMRNYNGSTWGAAYVPGSAAVVSFNGRTGAVNPTSGDYNAGQVTVSPTVAGASTVQAALAALETLAGTKLNSSAVSAFGLTLIDDADAAAARTTLGAAAASHNHAWADITSGVPAALSTIGGLTPAADRVPYYTGSGTAALATITSFARSILDDADAAAVLVTIGAASSGHGHSNATTGASGFMSNTDKSKLDGIADGANLYVHPTGDGNLHVPATSTTNNGRFLKAGATAGSLSWATLVWGDVTSVPAALTAVGALTPAADRIAYFTDGTTAALATITSFARSILDDADASTVRGTIGAAATSHTHAIGDLPEATAAQFRANTSGRVLSTDKVWSAAATSAVAYSATVTLDFSSAFNFEIAALTGNLTLANPSNLKVGQSGFVRLLQDGTGSRTITYGTNWIFSGGDPALSTAANAVDYLFYTVVGASAIVATLMKDVK